jgi:mannose-1-phosphate guanylyltransferase
MAGGIGTRFWPMSKTSQPKQFIDILGSGQTLIQQTFNRFLTVCPKENILIVTNEIYRQQCLDQLEGISENQILCEPCRKNTAPCIAYACYKIHQQNPDARVVVAPSDHVILKEQEFTEIISTALKTAAVNDWLITLGIKPSRPDTGYGYIQFNEDSIENIDIRIKKVKNFTEKPQLEKAKEFLASGDFLWNAGIFIWSLKSIITAFESFLPEINKLFKDGLGIYNTGKEQDFINEMFPVCQNISIDYGVMEKARNVYVLTSDFGWSDLGTWGSLYSIREKDDEQNTIVGDNVMVYDTSNCIVNVPKKKLVVLQGLDDFIVVEEDGVLLICKKEDEQMIRKFVDDVGEQKGKQFV